MASRVTSVELGPAQPAVGPGSQRDRRIKRKKRKQWTCAGLRDECDPQVQRASSTAGLATAERGKMKGHGSCSVPWIHDGAAADYKPTFLDKSDGSLTQITALSPHRRSNSIPEPQSESSLPRLTPSGSSKGAWPVTHLTSPRTACSSHCPNRDRVPAGTSAQPSQWPLARGLAGGSTSAITELTPGSGEPWEPPRLAPIGPAFANGPHLGPAAWQDQTFLTVAFWGCWPGSPWPPTAPGLVAPPWL